MSNKREISVQINIGAKLEDAQKRISGLQDQLNKLNIPASVRGEFSGLFSSMEKEIEKLSQKTAGGKLKFIDNAAVEKSIDKIDSLYDLLIQKFESKGIAAAGLKQDQAAFSAIQNAIKSYEVAMKSVASEESKINAELDKQYKAKEKLLAQQKEQKIVTEAEKAAQEERVKAAKKEERDAEKRVKEARLALEKRISESSNYTKEDIDRKGSGLRKTKEFRAYNEASGQYANAKKAKKKEETTLLNMATLEEQKKAVSEIDLKIQNVKDRLEDFNKTQKAAKEASAFEEIKKQLSALEGIDLSKYGIDLEDIKNVDDLKKALEQLANISQKNAKVIGKNFASSVKGLGETYKDLGEDINESAHAVREFNEENARVDGIKARIKSFLGMSGAVDVLKSSLRNAFATIKELDATMTEMAVVTDLSVGDYWDQLPEYSKQASALGVSINSAYKAATLYYQQGLKSNEVTKMSAETLKMARIAGLSAEEATDKMTAALRGFNMELNKTSTRRVADVYSELAAITAASTQEIANAMTKTASIANSAGMEFETTAAFLSQIIETTRESAETAGTAMKTIIARFQELKKAPEEIGEIDGEIIDANKIETALRSVGVALRDSSGQFRALDDVFMELSSKWDGLDTNTQRYIATIAAGSRQQSRFIAMMSDYGRTQELVAAANNSAGASQEQFNKTLETVQSKLEKLQNAWDEFTMGIMESDLVKTGIDILTKFLEIINKATSSFDGLFGSLTKISGIIAVFKMAQKLFNKFEPQMIKLYSKVTQHAYQGGRDAMKAFKKGNEDEEAASRGEAPQEGAGPESSQPKGKTFTQKLGGLKTGYNTLKGQKDRRAEIDNLKDDIKNNEDSYNQNKANLEGYQKEVSDARSEKAKLLKGENGKFRKVESLSEEEKKKYEGLKMKEADAKKNIKDTTAALTEHENKVADLNKKEDEYLAASKQGWSDIADGVGAVGAGITAVGTLTSMLGGVLQSLGLEEVGEVVTGIGNALMIVGTVISTLVSIISLLGTTVAGVALLAIGIAAIVTQIQNNSPEKKLERAREEVDAMAEAAGRAKEKFEGLTNALDSLDQKQKSLENLTKGTDEWNRAVQDVNASVLDLINQYPELAGFVENDGGVLTIDVNSDEVKAVINDYEKAAVAAKGAELGAKANLNRQQTEYDLSKMDDKVFEKFQTEGQAEAIGMAALNTLASTAIGAASGAAIGAGIGAQIGAAGGTIAFPGIGTAVGTAGAAGIGALWGVISGGVTGLAAGLASFQYTVDQVEKSNEQNRENVKELAQAYANGETGETVEEIAAYIERNGIAAGDAAKQMAESLLEESDTMLEFGNTLNAMDAQQKAYYQAMATNAQQLIDLGKYTEDQINQMTMVVDEDLMQTYEDERKAELEALKKKNTDDSNNTEFADAKEDYVAQQYGANARIDGNKILDEKGEVIREFADDDAWIAEMAAADATLSAAEAMEQVPGIILKNMETIAETVGGAAGLAAQAALEKAFSGEDLTKAELETFEESLGEATYTYTDTDGNTHEGTGDDAWDALGADAQAIWGSKESYLRSLDKDYANIETMWGQLSDSQKKAYGWDGTEEGLEKALENFEDTFTEIVDEQGKAWEKANKDARALGLEDKMSGRMNSSAAAGWFANLAEIAPAGRDISGVNSALNDLLDTFASDEDANAAMAQINAIDKMDINAWKNLADVFEDMGIEYNTAALQEFIDKGIEASGAIRKIDFSNLHNQINNTYKLLDKVSEGGRTYSEEDYKALIAANRDLEKSFVQIGNQFYYIDGTMQELKDALKENTVALLKEANAQLEDKINLATLFSDEVGKFGSVNAMDREELIKYLTHMRGVTGENGQDISALGIAGLSMTTSFATATDEQLKAWAGGISSTVGQKETWEDEYTNNLYKADVQTYAQDNEASYNASMALKRHGGEDASKYQDALRIQAIQSGAVSNAILEQYSAAIAAGDEDEIERLGAIIAESVEKTIESSENRNSYKDLVDRVEAAIIDARQKEIDKLSELNDSINTANSNLINKIQEQIDADRQARENEKTEQNIQDMQARMAYLSMDTSGANSLEMMSLGDSIEQAEEDYQNTLIDQSLQSLQDANEKAAQQRERQIAILEEQLRLDEESGAISEQAAGVVATSIEQLKNGTTLDQTEMYNLLFASEGKGLGALAAEDWESDMASIVAMATNYTTEKEDAKRAKEEAEKQENADAILKEYQEKAQSDIVSEKYTDLSSEGAKSAISSAYNDYKAKVEAAGGTAVSEADFAKGLTGYDDTADKANTRDEALVKGQNALKKNFLLNKDEAKNDKEVQEALEAWKEATGQEDDAAFWAAMEGHYASRHGNEGAIGATAAGYDDAKDRWFDLKLWGNDDSPKDDIYVETGDKASNQKELTELWNATYEPIMEKGGYNTVVTGSGADSQLFIRKKGGTWYEVLDQGANLKSNWDNRPERLINFAQEFRKSKAYKTGGLADFTGPAWLDGTKTRPEYVLSAAQTERFFSLVDVLENFDKREPAEGHQGDNHFAIEINVEKLENDYDVEKLANKIRSMIYEDATYRNVNAINLIR